jgi:hypothetical protein
MLPVSIATVVSGNRSTALDHRQVHVDAVGFDVAEQPTVPVDVITRPRLQGDVEPGHQTGHHRCGISVAALTALGRVDADESDNCAV